MTVVAKMNGKLVEIVKTADAVKFSNHRGWVMICIDFEQADLKKSQFKWLPASTRFEWVREFSFG
jgi:phosphotransferase system IIA component